MESSLLAFSHTHVKDIYMTFIEVTHLSLCSIFYCPLTIALHFGWTAVSIAASRSITASHSSSSDDPSCTCTVGHSRGRSGHSMISLLFTLKTIHSCRIEFIHIVNQNDHAPLNMGLIQFLMLYDL